MTSPSQPLRGSHEEAALEAALEQIKPIRTWTPEEVALELQGMVPKGLHRIQDLHSAFQNPEARGNFEILRNYGVTMSSGKLIGLENLEGKDANDLYRRYMRRETALGNLPGEWMDEPVYLVPTTTGPYFVVGPPELVVEAVGRATMPLVTPSGLLMAVRPAGVAIPDLRAEGWWRLAGAVPRGRAGLLWIPPQGIGS